MTNNILPEVSFEMLKTDTAGNTGFLSNESKIKLLTSKLEFEEEFAKYEISQATQHLDFTSGQVLLIDYGRHGTTLEDKINVDAIVEYRLESESGINLYLIVKVTRTSPGNLCPVTDAIASPYIFLYIPSTKDVLVQRTHKTDTPCQ